MLRIFAALATLLVSSIALAGNSSLPNLNAGGAVSGTDLFYDVQTAGVGGVKVTAAQLHFPMVYASDYAVSSSSSDNTAALNNAISAAVANGGGTVILPPGTIKVCSQIQINSNGVNIQGAGNGSSFVSPQTSGGTVWQACGLSIASQLLWGSASGTSIQYGGSLSGITFDGNDKATDGLQLKDTLNSRFQNLTFYKQVTSAIHITNSTNGGTQLPTGRFLFDNVFIQNTNNNSNSTIGIDFTGTTAGGSEGISQGTWVNIIINHVNGAAISVGEDNDQMNWINLQTNRPNANTGHAITTTGDGSSVIGNWNFTGVGTTSDWNMACCSAANVAWTVFDMANTGFNTGITISNVFTGTGAAGVAYLDQSGNLQTNGTIKTTATTASSSTTTGAIVDAGGAGVAGNLYVGGTFNISNSAANLATFGNASLGGVATPSSIATDASYATSCLSTSANKIYLLGTVNGAYGIGVCAGEVWFGSGGSFVWANTGSQVMELSNAGGLQLGAVADPGAGNISAAGSILAGTTVKATTAFVLPVYTIAGLPGCGAGQKGEMAFVSDTVANAAATYHGTVTGGGATTVNSPVSCTGSLWQYD